MIAARLCGLCVVAAAAVARAGLGPADLLLVTNKNVPASADLAKHYAQTRHVPAGRVLPLDLPGQSEEISPQDYDAKIAGPVRQFLQSPDGSGVRCVVLFYGVPLRVTGRPTSDADRAELTALRQRHGDLQKRTAVVATALENVVRSIGMVPEAAGIGPSNVEQRIASATQQLQQGTAAMADPAKRQAVEQQLVQVKQIAIDQANAALAASSVHQSFALSGDINAALAKPRDAESRALVRTLAARNLGTLALLQIVQLQTIWIDGEETDASVDSELALVNDADYPFFRWQPNPLNFRHPSTPLNAIMVSRIDAPTPQIARRIIDESAAVEAGGLEGRFVLDARGLPASQKAGDYGWFDQILRDFGGWLKTHTKVDLVLDDRAQVLLPGSVRDAAIYCGWYSLRQYIASCSFKPGAVAYHVASLEMVSLHEPREKGWVANLLKDGVDATLGAVGEPYLSSFPRPDEFFPLLMTGKVTLAEAYWATCPMASWKITLIGDPLYRPFGARPVVAEGDLSPELRQVCEKVAATPPASR